MVGGLRKPSSHSWIVDTKHSSLSLLSLLGETDLEGRVSSVAVNESILGFFLLVELFDPVEKLLLVLLNLLISL